MRNLVMRALVTHFVTDVFTLQFLLLILMVLGAVSFTLGQSACTPPPGGLQNWWPGDDNTKDIVGQSDGTLQGNVTFTSGEVGPAFTFDGSSALTLGSAGTAIGASDFTALFWLNTTSTGVAGVLGKRVGCTHNHFFDVRVLDNTAEGGGHFGQLLIELDQGDGVNYNAVITNQAVNDGSFHLISIVRQNTKVLVYIDGLVNSEGTTPEVIDITNTGVFTAGQSACNGAGPNIPLIGQMDEIAIFNRALLASEISAIFQAGRAGMCKGCQMDPTSLMHGSSEPLSQDGKNTFMIAIFTPAFGGKNVSLAEAKKMCGFAGFDWQQVVTNIPNPSGVFPSAPSSVPLNLYPDGSLKAPPLLDDPPPGGYKHLPGYDPFPFYFPKALEIAQQQQPSGCVPLPSTSCFKLVTDDDMVMRFADAPADPCLPGGNSALQAAFCGGKSAPPLSFLSFTTSLVGINQDGSASAPLRDTNGQALQWSWTDTYNGTNGGIPTTFSTEPVDPNGTGGITITSINGVPQTPPTVNCSANPNFLWPPNGKSISVNISGAVTPGTQPLVLDRGAFAITDSEGQVQPSGAVSVGSDGSYSFAVSLIASRDGTNKNGRQYTISVSALDTIGNLGSCSAVVNVPHDQGH